MTINDMIMMIEGATNDERTRLQTAINSVKIEVPRPVTGTPAPVGAYGPEDLAPRQFNGVDLPWLNYAGRRDGYDWLLGKVWWALNRVAEKVGFIITVLRACPLTGPGDTHHGCDQPGGGREYDCVYPPTREELTRIVDAFLEVCCPPFPPGQEWKDLKNESEIRMGSDAFPLTSNWHVQIDDSMHHRKDDPLYPHWHGRVGPL